jgi:hypothetical protein
MSACGTLGLTGLLERFDGRIFSAEEVEHGKPAPDLFLHAAATIGADPARCAVVEDSRHGVDAARAAGMCAFAYAGGVTSAERLAGPGTVVFSEMHELPPSSLCGGTDFGIEGARSAAIGVRSCPSGAGSVAKARRAAGSTASLTQPKFVPT